MKSLLFAVALLLSSSAALAQNAELRHGASPVRPGPQAPRQVQVVMDRNELATRLERMERLLEEVQSQLDKKGNSRTKMRKALDELEDVKRMVSKAPEMRGGYQPPHPLPPPPPPVVEPIHEARLRQLTQAMAREAFPREKLMVLRDGSRDDNFLVSQTKALLGQFSFSNDKLEAVRILWPRVLDRNNGFQLYEAFPFAADKEKLRQIIGS